MEHYFLSFDDMKVMSMFGFFKNNIFDHDLLKVDVNICHSRKNMLCDDVNEIIMIDKCDLK